MSDDPPSSSPHSLPDPPSPHIPPPPEISHYSVHIIAINLSEWDFRRGSGTLLYDSRFVLTAAHCIVGMAPGDMLVQCAVHGGAVEWSRRVRRVFIHPHYAESPRLASFSHDIAVLELDSALDVSSITPGEHHRVMETVPLEVAVGAEFTPYPSRRLFFPGWSSAVVPPPHPTHTICPTVGYMQIMGWEGLAPLHMWRSRQWDPQAEPDLLLTAVWAACDKETGLPQYIHFEAGGVQEGWDTRNLWLTKETAGGEGRFGAPGDSGAPVLANIGPDGELRMVGMVVGGVGGAGARDVFGMGF